MHPSHGLLQFGIRTQSIPKAALDHLRYIETELPMQKDEQLVQPGLGIRGLKPSTLSLQGRKALVDIGRLGPEASQHVRAR